MTTDAYRSFRRRVDRRLGEIAPEPRWEVECADPIAVQLAAVLHEASRTAQAVSACLDDGVAVDRNKYDFVLSMLDRILSFDEWVLAESEFHSAGARYNILRRWALGAGAERKDDFSDNSTPMETVGGEGL